MSPFPFTTYTNTLSTSKPSWLTKHIFQNLFHIASSICWVFVHLSDLKFLTNRVQTLQSDHFWFHMNNLELEIDIVPQIGCKIL